MKVEKKLFSGLNNTIYYKLSPFLFLYLVICILFAKSAFVGDEVRYVMFANNLLSGFYSHAYPNINLWNGPGYPLLIGVLLFFKFPFIVLKLLNALLLYFSLIISYMTFSIYSSKKSSYLCTILLGLYFPIFEMIPFILTEPLAWFLISLVCFLLIKNYQQKTISWKLVILASLSIAYLAMTKIIFGYVILLMLFISIFLFLLPRFRSSAKKSIFIFFLSFSFCLPWLIYTYSLTNKVFYWTNSGSMSLYTMSTPYANELGDWHNSYDLQLNPNHRIFMDSISKLQPLERDEAYKRAAIGNIKSHPKKFLSNWIANVGRLLFSYPYSNTQQTIKSYFTILPNMFIVVIIVLLLAVSIVYHKKIPDGIMWLFLFILIYLLGSSLVSAYRRMFYITMPFWFLFISYVLNNIISVNTRDKPFCSTEVHEIDAG